MPYLDKVKQRKVQREWAAAKAATMPPIPQRTIVPNTVIANAKDITEGIVTWEECIARAKTCGVLQTKIDRIAIARIAMLACTIRKGGDFRSAAYKKGEYGGTIHRFAEEVGMNHKTLGDWIKITMLIVNRLPKGTKTIDFHAAKLSLDYCGWRAPQEELLTMYWIISDPKGAMRDVMYFVKAVQTAHRVVHQHGKAIIPLLDTRRKKAVTEFVALINKVF